jgi:molybdopterin molybdotransferase
VTLSFSDARDCVLERVKPSMSTEEVAVLDSCGRILAETIHADRDYPPFPRAARDGFAVKAENLPGELRIIGEVRAGEVYPDMLVAGEAVEIMTGAPLPEGADAVVMVEHTVRTGAHVRTERAQQAGDNFASVGSEATRGTAILSPGQRIGFSEVSALAMVGRERVQVYRKPHVAILPTGDELVDVQTEPETFQIRNTNAWSLSVQVLRAGGEPQILPIARDNYESTRSTIEKGLQADLLLLSGGVSAGKYDIVERVLSDLGAEFYFDRVKIQPGQPLVFGLIKGTPFFGLPGNPASTMVTFEVFARAGLERMAGASASPLPLLRARLTKEFRHKSGLTRFLPAHLSDDGSTVEPVAWKGSGDIPSITRANAFLVADEDREAWAAGDDIRVLLK